MRKYYQMKKNILAVVCVSLLVVSCGTPAAYLETFAPEEASLGLVKITDSGTMSVIGHGFFPGQAVNNPNLRQGISKNGNCYWTVSRLLDVSPDGTQIAYITESNKQRNVMVRNLTNAGMSTQRTFRSNVTGFTWGNDGKIYFEDNHNQQSHISSVKADAGSMMDLLTNGDVIDTDPVISQDGSKMFFVRADEGASIWALDRRTSTLTSCSRGYNPCLIPGNNDAFYCVRNSMEGRSEIWYVDFVSGKESLVISDENHSFTNPRLSPDGKWLVFQGNAVSLSTKKSNLDIFVAKADGSRLTQLTFHTSSDCCPVWSADGNSIYFVSSRANKNRQFNVWKMNFMVED